MLRAHLGRANYITSRARWLLAGAADDAAASVPSGASGREKQFKFAANELGKYLLAIILAPGTGAARLTCVCVCLRLTTRLLNIVVARWQRLV